MSLRVVRDTYYDVVSISPPSHLSLSGHVSQIDAVTRTHRLGRSVSSLNYEYVLCDVYPTRFALLSVSAQYTGGVLPQSSCPRCLFIHKNPIVFPE